MRGSRKEALSTLASGSSRNFPWGESGNCVCSGAISLDVYKRQYLDIEHKEFHPLAKWEEFIADPGKYLNGMIEGEFEE